MDKVLKVRPGRPYPLGATWDGIGVNFAIFSENAEKVELCLFDSPDSKSECYRATLPERTDMVWHGYIPGVLPGQLYGYRVHGPYAPEAGHRFNPAKVVLDPYAKAIGRDVEWKDELFGYTIGDKKADLAADARDNAAFAPLAAVIDPAFTWGNDKPPGTPWHETVIYELHVKGFTRQHPGIPERLRGTYAALSTEEAIRHLLSLGVTAVELMPVHHHADERYLLDRGLSNYWGYNTLAFFAPDRRYALDKSPEGAVREFRTMVRALHAAGIEVILDVVYNHTAEGSHLGPTLSFRGIDNRSYYRLEKDQRYYTDFTGCGNTLNMVHPRTLQLIMDSLRYWVLEMRVDGFRFDLASALARELYDVEKLGAFFDIIHQDPVLSQVKLIAEPWDIGPGGYQVGNFPVLWTEWNGKYRDTIRRFWKGDEGVVSEMATRVAGSSDLYEWSGRRPYASINFVTSHDGFTLADLVSYNGKHNEANGENNADGDNNNMSWNCGAEGPTDDPAVKALRERQRRNFLATLFLSQGVPMLRSGDELGHSQKGNNNAYCQDGPLGWLDWTPTPEKRAFLEFVHRLIALRRRHPVLRRRKFLQGKRLNGSEAKDVAWYSALGLEMTDKDWQDPGLRRLGFLLAGDAILDEDDRGEPVTDDTLLVLLDTGGEHGHFMLPIAPPGHYWEFVLDTARGHGTAPGRRVYRGGQAFGLEGHSLALFRLVHHAPEHPEPAAQGTARDAAPEPKPQPKAAG